MSLERALELADAAAGRGYPNPTVGAVVVSAAGEVVGEGVSEPAGGRHAEVVALDAAGGRRRGGTLFVTMEPCAHHGRTPPCVDAILGGGPRAGRRRLGRPERGGRRRRRARCARRGSSVELLDLERARRQNEAWRTWAGAGAPVRRAQARRVARRSRRRPGAALGDRRGVAPPRPRAAGGGGRGRGRDGHRARRCAAARRARRRRRHASRAASRSVAGRFRAARSSSCARARSPTSSRRSPPRASSRSSSRAARRSRRRSSRTASSTACSSSSRPCSPAEGRRCWAAPGADRARAAGGRAAGRRRAPRQAAPRELTVGGDTRVRR